MEFTKKNTFQIKGVAIILMLLHHVLVPDVLANYNVSTWPFNQYGAWCLYAIGKECVPFYAFLSGYGLTVSLKKNNNLNEWYIKHILSLYSSFWFVFVISFIITFLFGQYPYYIYFSDGLSLKGCLYVVIDFLGLSGVFETPSMNGAWWYMSAALFFVILTPFIVRLCSKFSSIAVLFMVVLLPRVLGSGFQGNNAILSFCLAYALGIVFAENNLFSKINEKVRKYNKKYRICTWIGLTLLNICFFRIFMLMNFDGKIFEFYYAIFPVSLIIYLYLYVINLPILREILAFLGKHSMNIFYIHIFILSSYCQKQIYALKNSACCVVVLLVASLIISLVIEQTKKVIHFDILIEKLKTVCADYMESERIC